MMSLFLMSTCTHLSNIEIDTQIILLDLLMAADVHSCMGGVGGVEAMNDEVGRIPFCNA